MRVAFTGHRPNKLGGYDNTKNKSIIIKNEILNKLKEIYIKNDLQYLITGMALGVDQWVAEIAIECGFPFYAYVPFKNQEAMWPKKSQIYYKYLLNHAYEVRYICEQGYAPWKMQKRNEAMVNDCDVLIAVWDGTKGGTLNCIEYAKKIKPIVFIDPNNL